MNITLALQVFLTVNIGHFGDSSAHRSQLDCIFVPNTIKMGGSEDHAFQDKIEDFEMSHTGGPLDHLGNAKKWVAEKYPDQILVIQGRPYLFTDLCRAFSEISIRARYAYILKAFEMTALSFGIEQNEIQNYLYEFLHVLNLADFDDALSSLRNIERIQSGKGWRYRFDKFVSELTLEHSAILLGLISHALCVFSVDLVDEFYGPEPPGERSLQEVMEMFVEEIPSLSCDEWPPTMFPGVEQFQRFKPIGKEEWEMWGQPFEPKEVGLPSLS